MSKNKKIILIVGAVVISLIVVGLLIYFIGFSKFGNINSTNNEESNNSKISKLYSELQKKKSFSFTTTLDDKNKAYYAKKDSVAYTETNSEGKETKFIIKDGNSYLLIDSEKKYYTYKNNEINLNKITDILYEIKDDEYTEGEEEIENNKYTYEEYEGITEFSLNLIKQRTNGEQQGKTRFYFNKNKLVYIKTMLENDEELLKVDISNKTENAIFEIPSDYNGA